MSYKDMFDANWVDLNIKAATEEEAFVLVSAKLMEAGVVNSCYLKGITERERNIPTGLITQHLNIALPHSDPEYVNKPFVFVARLTDEVVCRQMGDSQEMPVKDLFFLGIKNGKEQVGLLQAFMNLFMDKKFVDQYRSTVSTKDVYQLFVNNI